jgi:hypothetical protein
MSCAPRSDDGFSRDEFSRMSPSSTQSGPRFDGYRWVVFVARRAAQIGESMTRLHEGL